MKTFGAALLLCAHADEETSLMQGLMRQSKLGASTGSSKEHRKDSTTKLMETATKMMKNGVTPDVLEFVSSTITELNTNVLGEITREYIEDQRYIDALLQRLTDAADAIPDDCEATNAILSGHNGQHKVCRSEEAVQCARCRKCEAELTVIWNRVKVAEAEMRRIHDAIHGEWCLRDGFEYHPTIPQCWDWPETGHWEGPETSQSVTEYCTTDVSSAIRDFRTFSIEHFSLYKTQLTEVNRLWTEYNVKIVECGACDTALDEKVSVCDGLQTDYRASVCTAASENRNHRRTFGHEWEDVLVTYRTAIGDCRVSPNICLTEPGNPNCRTEHGNDVPFYRYDASGSICDANAVPHNAACKCTGILEEEQDRKREWEALHIVTCLLETVYTHVVHAIETDEPCITTESNPEQVESEVNYCHVIEASLTANLTHTMCMNSGDPYNVDDCLPSPPPLCPPIEPPCTSQFIWEEQGSFEAHLQTSYNAALAADSDLANYFTALSEKGWSGCSAPLVCVECEGLTPQNPNLDLAQDSSECKAHERYLRPGMTDGETFRCLATTHGEHGSCVSAAARCNGHSNCADDSDESGCDTLWGMPADLRQASVEECREGATVAPGSFDDVQFFCASGECTSIEARCNGVNNCADGSDEAGCTFTSAGVTMEATSGFTSSQETISTSSMVFHDRDYHFDSLGSLSGMTYIKSSNEDKHTSQAHVQMKLRMPQPMTVYVAKTVAHELAWLSEVGADGNPLWRVSELQGASYSGSRMTRQSEWIMGAPADYESVQYQTGGDPLMQHEDWAHARHTEQLDQAFLNGDVAPSRIPSIPWGDDHFSTVVYERTFSAGVVSMPGNSGGDGSYLMLVANPNTPPVPPVLPPTGEAQYLGCFVDDSARDLGAMESGGATYTFATCLARCEGSRFMSLQWGGECFCADAYGTASHYARVSDSQCNVVREPCSSSGTHNCGGTWHQAIYAIGNLGDEIMLQFNPGVGANGLCVSMSQVLVPGACANGQCVPGGNAGCDESSCNMHVQSDATMQTCDSFDAGQKYVHDTHSGQLRSSLGDNRCLHVSTSSFYLWCEPLTLQPCMSHDTRQQFNLEESWRLVGATVWRNVATNLAIHNLLEHNTVDNMVIACGGVLPTMYFDAVSAVETSLHEQQCSGTFEAEDATLSGAVEHADTASAGHQGFTGRSFVDYLAPTGDFVEWTVQGCNGGSATASFRYALGSGNRPMQVLVNGAEVESALSFPSTGSWASWSEASFTVSLNAGTNVVKLVASGSSGANMDSLIIH